MPGSDSFRRLADFELLVDQKTNDFTSIAKQGACEGTKPFAPFGEERHRLISKAKAFRCSRRKASFKKVGATRRLLNFSWPVYGAGKPVPADFLPRQ